MKKKQQNKMYRVYDHKNNYIQTYSDFFQEGIRWAKDCASRMNGRVDQIIEGSLEGKAETIFTVSSKK